MKRTLVLSMVIAFMATSCVSKKIFNELEGKYADLKKENRKLSDNNGDLTKTKNLLETDLKNTKDELARVSGERNQLQSELAAANNQLKTLQASYAALERNSDDALQANMKKNRELLAQLDAK
ncbi:MAG: cell envelope biogenesis protein OmpA, partial [Flavobacterium sp.]